MNNITSQFPIYTTHPDVVYLDSASTTQVTQTVLDAMQTYERSSRANVHRGMYPLAARATKQYEGARQKVADFIQATSSDEIIFTSGTTASLNMLAQLLESDISAEDNIVLTDMEHHGNLIPWQQLAKRVGCELRFIPVKEDFTLDYEAAKKLIDTNTKIVSAVYASNTLGTINEIKTILSFAKEVSAYSIIDAAQAVAHVPIDVQLLDCDFLVASGHKMYGPTGIGFLYGKKDILVTLAPVSFGGNMIDTVSYTEATWADVPFRFEAGTPPIAAAIGLGAACDYLLDIGFYAILLHEKNLTEYLLQQLQETNVQIIGSVENEKRIGVVSFVLAEAHPHDVADILGQQHICVRAGHHCTLPLMKKFELSGTVRVSLGMYSTKEDIDQCITAIQKVQKLFL